jgi:hypothetical protein
MSEIRKLATILVADVVGYRRLDAVRCAIDMQTDLIEAKAPDDRAEMARP